MAPSSTAIVSWMGLLSTMCFRVTVLAAWSTDTSSPARFLAVALAAASGVVAGAAAGAAGVVAGLVVWAKPGPAMAGTATAATSRYANVFITASSLRRW